MCVWLHSSQIRAQDLSATTVEGTTATTAQGVYNNYSPRSLQQLQPKESTVTTAQDLLLTAQYSTYTTHSPVSTYRTHSPIPTVPKAQYLQYPQPNTYTTHSPVHTLPRAQYLQSSTYSTHSPVHTLPTDHYLQYTQPGTYTTHRPLPTVQ